MGKKVKGLLGLVLILLVVLAVLYSAGVPRLQEIGFLTGAQGLEAQFHSVYWEGSWYSQTEKPAGKQPSMLSFGYEMTFDPDAVYDGWPDLCGSQQTFTVDTEFEPKHYAWSVDKGEVTFPNGTRARKYYQFEMWRYKLTWRVNIWMSGTEGEVDDYTSFNIITWRPNYADTQVWLRIVPKNYPYFKDNPDQLYIAPGYLACSEIMYACYDQDKREIMNDPDMTALIDLIPKKGEALGIYYQRGGTPIEMEQKLLSYQGMELDPSVFRNEYWTKITLLNFPDLTWFEWQIWHKWKLPSVHLTFFAYAYVVGRWTVYIKTGEVPQLTPHNPPTWQRDPISDFLKAVGEWWGKNWMWVLFGFVVVVLLVVYVLKNAGKTIVVTRTGIRVV